MRNRAEGVVIALIGLAATAGALAIPGPGRGDTWAGFLPLTAGLFLSAAGLRLVLAPIIASRSDTRAEAGRSQMAGTLRVLGLFVVALCYIWAIGAFGYEFPTAAMAPFALWLFGLRSPLGLVASAILAPAMLHILFFRLLGVFPPFPTVLDPIRALTGG